MQNIKENGITIVSGPSGRDALVDIVFVHGFNGHPKKTWMNERNTFYWPWQLRDVISEARIMTFGYDANIRILAAKNLMGIHDHAVNLLARLRNERPTLPASKRPLVFVCHSMGGLIVKEALIISSNGPNYRGISLSTVALFFFGTPHRGAVALDSKRLALLINISKAFFTKLPGDLENDLRTRSKELFSINDRFKDIDLILNKNVTITCFYERIETANLGDVVVDQDSAALGYGGEEDIGLAADHRGLVQYEGVDDDLYDFVTKTLLFKLDKFLVKEREQRDTASMLGPIFSSHIRLRERQRVPYLTWLNWYKAITELGQAWGGGSQVGLSRIGTYSESWMNLLLVFGAENIIASRFMEQLPIEDDLVKDVANPFAIQLSILAILVGIAGCDTWDFKDGLPIFSGGNARLEFTSSGPFTWVGRFSQESELPAYFTYDAKTVGSATLYSAGGFLYQAKEAVPLKESFRSQLPADNLFRDLDRKRCRCSDATQFSNGQRMGVRPSSLALLAADTPRAVRVFPTKLCRVMEAAHELSSMCPFWRNEASRTRISLRAKLGPIIGSIDFVSRDQYMRTMFWGERIVYRVLRLAGEEVRRPAFIELGFSWLASCSDYKVEGNDTRIKARPQWDITPEMQESGLVVLDDVMLACDVYLRCGEITVLYEGNADKAHFHTCISCQLQEVDWWLGNNQALAACVTLNMLGQIWSFGIGTNEANCGSLILFTERRVVRAILVFRAILVAMLLGLGLDNSEFEDSNSELGTRRVFLR